MVDEAGDHFYNEEHCTKTQIENWIIDGLGDCPLELARNIPNSSSQTLQLPAGWKGYYSYHCNQTAVYFYIALRCCARHDSLRLLRLTSLQSVSRRHRGMFTETWPYCKERITKAG